MKVDLENTSFARIDNFMSKMRAEFGNPPFYCNGSCMGMPDEQNVLNELSILIIIIIN
jgi:hypothetical protein